MPTSRLTRIRAGVKAALISVTGLPAKRVFDAPRLNEAWELGKRLGGDLASVGLLSFQELKSSPEQGTGRGKLAAYFYRFEAICLSQSYAAPMLSSTRAGGIYDVHEDLLRQDTGIRSLDVGDDVTGEVFLTYGGGVEVFTPEREASGGQSGFLMSFETSEVWI